jgi:hypothetical protein
MKDTRKHWCIMADMTTDFLIYTGIGILMGGIGMLIGSQLLTTYYQKRFITVAQQCSDTASLAPIADELERET